MLYALAPKAVDQILHMAYNVFPESAAASGKKDDNERASGEAVALSHLIPARPVSSAAIWSSGCSSARATSTCSSARARARSSTS